MSFSYSPPVGFGNAFPQDPANAPKKKPGTAVDPITGAPLAGNTVATQELPAAPTAGQVLYQSSYPGGASAYSPGSTYQPAYGSRDAALESDPQYLSLLAALGIDEATARAQTTYQENAARNQLTGNLSELGRVSQKERDQINAVLRSRGTAKSSQQEALQAESFANQGRGEANYRAQTEDAIASYEAMLQGKVSDYGRQRLLGAGDAASRLQQARDAALSYAAQQQAMGQWTSDQAAQNAAFIAAIQAQIASAQNVPTGPAANYQPSTLDKLNAMSPSDQEAFRAYVTAQAQQQATRDKLNAMSPSDQAAFRAYVTAASAK